MKLKIELGSPAELVTLTTGVTKKIYDPFHIGDNKEQWGHSNRPFVVDKTLKYDLGKIENSDKLRIQIHFTRATQFKGRMETKNMPGYSVEWFLEDEN